MSGAPADVKRDVAQIIKDIFDAFQAHDPEGTEHHFHPDTTVWDVFVPQLFRGPEERARFHEADQAQMQARGPLALTINETEVDVWGDTAIAKYYLSFEYQPPNATSGKVRITDVLHNIDGRWLVVHHHEGMVPNGVPPLDESKPS